MPESKAPTTKLLELIRTGRPDQSGQEESAARPSRKNRKTEILEDHKESLPRPVIDFPEEMGKKAVNIKSNFHKVPNLVCDEIAAGLTMPEEVIYHHIIRLSWGWNRNWCRVGIHYFQENSSVKSRKAIGDAIKGLLERGLIRHSEVDGRIERDNKGTVYIVPLPDDADVLSNSTLPDSILNNSILLKDSAGSASDSILGNSVPGKKPHEKQNDGGVLRNSILQKEQIKDNNKDNLKDTLSPRAIISGFYKGIGQSRISKEKRERAENDFEELSEDGFDPEDIQFAVEWTLKNAKEELYDFSIIKHTIGQAMAARKKVEEEEARRREREKAAVQREAEEKKMAEEEAQIKAYKEGLDAEERARLREKAEAEIRNSGQYKKEFITDYLIEAMENNLIRGRIDMKPSE
jgi:hypothetical protein